MGIELAKWVSANSYPAKVVLMSGTPEENIYGGDGEYNALIIAGVITKFLGKPAGIEKLLLAVEAAAEKAQQGVGSVKGC